MAHHSDKKKKKSPLEAFVTGLAMVGLFGFLLLRTDAFFWIFPMIFAGILPAIEGFRRIQRNKKLGYSIEQIEPDDQTNQSPVISREKQLLLAAKKEKGKLTPAIAALNSDLSMEEARKLLDEMAKKGYADIQINTEGQVFYIFPEFSNEKKFTELEE